MSVPPSDDLGQRLAAYAEALQQAGAVTSGLLRDAFAAVPRHRFLPRFLHRGEEHTMDPEGDPTDEVLDLVYADRALLVRTGQDGDPPCSSSQPFVMARMLEALELAPGLRVLEIGAGTGYNAALIHQVTGARVVTVEAGERTAVEAAAAIRRVGLEEHVEVVHGDGYAGWPEEGPYDRIVVTCGIAGLPPAWLDQLAEDGIIVAPVAHAGLHPSLAVRHEKGLLRGWAVLWGDFMHAAGPLRPAKRFHHDPAEPVPAGGARRMPEAVPALDLDGYHDLWCWLGALDERITCAGPEPERFGPQDGLCALLDEQDGAAWVHTDGSITLAGAPGLADHLVTLVGRWDAAGRPALTEWIVDWGPGGSPEAPLLEPRWRHPVLGAAGTG